MSNKYISLWTILRLLFMRIRFCAILLVCLTVLLPLRSDAKSDMEYIFSTISVSEGLSQNTVLAITQDHSGNLWFATLDGLNKYNANDFTVYRNVEGDSTSIAANTVRTLFLDTKGRVWAGTDAGLSLYDMRKDRFENWPTYAGAVTGIAEIGEDRLLVGTAERLQIFDAERKAYLGGAIPDYMAKTHVSSLCRTGDNVYIGTRESGLFVYSIERNEFRRISHFTSTSQINVILSETPSVLWIGTEGDGLFRMDMATNLLENWRHSGRGGSIASNYVRSLGFDDSGRLWIGTFSGLSIMDGDGVVTLQNDPFSDGSISQNSVRSIFVDRQQGIWLGTYFGGVNYWNPLKNRFRNIHRSEKVNSLNDNIVTCIREDGEGVLWIGTNSGGVNMYDIGKGKFLHYPIQMYNRSVYIESNDIKAIHIPGDSPYIYVGVHAGGMNVLDRNTGRIRHLGSRTDRPVPMDVYSIIEADGRNLWVGSLDGLWMFNMADETFTSFGAALPGPKRIKTLCVDSTGSLWVGGEDGLCVYSVTGDGMKKTLEEALPGVFERIAGKICVQCFLESSTGTVWIGTRSGLYGYDPQSGNLEYFDSSFGFPSNVIHGIEEDSYGRLWISTDNGLSCFNPYSDTVRNYTANDGLQSNLFNTNANCRSSDGVMYFGGINGISSFSPENLKDNPYSPNPVLTRLKVLNRVILPDDGSGILDESISTVSSITLKHQHNYFSLDFSVPDYLSNGHSSFAYCLEGFDREWNVLNGQRSVSYSNLSPGKYRFLLKAANSDGKWNEEPTVLEIRVKPVWYRSILAYIMFSLLAVATVYAVVRFVLERTRMENSLRLEKQENENNEELNQMKMRFFINISHELRNPLTLILDPLKELIDKASDLSMRKQLKYVEKNARRMLHLVNQLMDYRRAELGVFRLKVREEDVSRIVRESWSYYENIARNKKLKYNFISGVGDRKMYVDAQYLDLIVNNLLSNAFKYTDEGSISVELSGEAGRLVLRVRDTGIGIAESERNRIFERFYQLDSNHIGSGIGLSLVHRLVELHHGEISIESTLGEGSCFIVSLPQDLGAYSPEELSNDPVRNMHSTNTRDMYALESEAGQLDTLGESDYVKRGRIMIVEDNEELRTYIYNGLSRYFEIVLAGNGAEALEVLRDGSEVDMIITDMAMPVMDGIKFCAAVKQNRETGHIPVIMISAKTDRRDIEEAIRVGADDYISKPFSRTLLAGKIQNIMKTRKRQYDMVTKNMDVIPEKITFNAVDEDFLKRAVEVIERNLDNVEFSTDVFAKEMNMSRSNLHIKMKTIVGESALEFIRKIRFKEACRLLEEGRCSISEISDRTGFSTPSYFATCFKKYMGCNPSDYMKKK